MKTKYSLLAILSVATIMSIGAIAPAIADHIEYNDGEEAALIQEAADKIQEDIDVACEKANRTIEDLVDKHVNLSDTNGEDLDELRDAICALSPV